MALSHGPAQTATILAGIVVGFFTQTAAAQLRAEKQFRVLEAAVEDFKAAAPAAPAVEAKPARKPGEAPRDKDLAEERFPGGASLKTDPELQRLVARSDEFVKENRHDLAAVLWQKVLDEAGDSLMTRDGRLYTSVRNDVERTLAQLPKVALMAYRITADGEAQAVIARNEGGEEGALGEVVRRFFLSSQGDDAAYRLACLALDRRDFVAAARYLQKILTVYPDPSVPRGEMLLRLAFAADQLGDQKTTDAALAALKSESAKPSSALVAAVQEAMAADAGSTGSAALSVWPIALGNPQRTGRMPSLPPEMTKKTMSELWVQETPLNVQAAQSPNNPYAATIMLGGFGGRVISRSSRQAQEEKSQPASREQLVGQWRNSGWMPTSQLLFDQGRVFMKTTDLLVGFNRQSPAVGAWESAWRNGYELDGYTQMTAQWRMNMGLAAAGGNDKPRMPLEILLFGDHVQAAMSISDGLIFSIEGKRLPKEGNAPPTLPKNAMRHFQYGVMPRRTRQNWLACYEAKSGKARWHRPAGDEEKDGVSDTGFLCAPVPFADSLLTAVTEGGTIWLYALSRDDGRTLWKSYLCDEPNGGCSPWSTVGIALDGSEAYIVCGTGVVFAVDASGGAVHWAVRYQRDPKVKGNVAGVNGMPGMPTDYKGWDQDTAIIQGRTLVVMASDCDRLFALDRRTGNLLWDSDRTVLGAEATYCVGVADRGLIVAGKNTVRRYDIPSGKIVWFNDIDASYARGCVTEDAVYVPVKDSVLVLDTKNGKELSQVGVTLTTGDPVGNLYSDGEKLWVTAPGRIFTLTNLEHRLAMLDKEIEGGSTTARLNRMRLYAKTSEMEAAVADLSAAYASLRKASGDEAAQETLLDSLVELKLAQQQPPVALQVLKQAYVQDSPAVSPNHAARQRDLLAVSLTALKSKPQPNAVAAVLGVLPLLDQDYLLGHASAAIGAAAKADDAPLLWEQLQKQDRGSAVALTALSKLAPDELKGKLGELRQAKDERLKLAAARVSLNLGDREALKDFLGLLKSEDAPIRLRSYQSLRSVSGQTFPFNPNDAQPAREKQLEAWTKWVAENGASFALKLPLAESDLPLGRTLFAFRNQVVEVDDARNNRWSKQLVNAWMCQGLPNGNRLVGIFGQSNNTHEVRELSDAGEVVGKPLRLPSGPLGLQRITNGNTLVSCPDTQQVLEYSTEGQIVWQMNFSNNERPMGVQRLDNGNTLIALSQGGRVIEVDRDKKTVWEARNVQGASSVSRLDNGNTLVAEMFTNRVIELDTTGAKIVWKKEGLNQPRDARRLPNGNILIAENNGIQELDAQGNTKWRLPGAGASCISVY